MHHWQRDAAPERHSHIGMVAEAQQKFPSNRVSTAKYTLLTFLPKSLFEQFRRIANVYFAITSVLMLIGTYYPKLFESPLSAFSTVFPLAIMLAITCVKEGFEDLKRHADGALVGSSVNDRGVSPPSLGRVVLV